jgi:hypothetical protein
VFIVPQDDEDEPGFLGRIKELMGMFGGKSLEDIAKPEPEESEDGNS